MELLFGCQQKPVINLTGHPVIVGFLPVGPAPELVGGRAVRVELDGPRAVPDAGVGPLHLDVAVAPLGEHGRRRLETERSTVPFRISICVSAFQ